MKPLIGSRVCVKQTGWLGTVDSYLPCPCGSCGHTIIVIHLDESPPDPLFNGCKKLGAFVKDLEVLSIEA